MTHARPPEEEERPFACARLRDGEAVVEACGRLDGRAALVLVDPARDALACRPPRLTIDLRRATRADATTARLVQRIAELAAGTGATVVLIRREHAPLFAQSVTATVVVAGG